MPLGRVAFSGALSIREDPHSQPPQPAQPHITRGPPLEWGFGAYRFNFCFSSFPCVAVGIRLAGVVGVAGGPLSAATRSPAFFCRCISATWPFFWRSEGHGFPVTRMDGRTEKEPGLTPSPPFLRILNRQKKLAIFFWRFQ